MHGGNTVLLLFHIAVTEAGKVGGRLSQDFFRGEYNLNHMIGKWKFPFSFPCQSLFPCRSFPCHSSSHVSPHSSFPCHFSFPCQSSLLIPMSLLIPRSLLITSSLQDGKQCSAVCIECVGLCVIMSCINSL